MKKYKLRDNHKEKLKEYLSKEIINGERTYEEWKELGFIDMGDFDEVPSRIELKKGYYDISQFIIKDTPISIFTDQEKELCEKALNGELLDIDSLDELFELDTQFYSREEWSGVNKFIQYLKE